MPLLFGCGYLGARVASLCLDRILPVRAFTRSPHRGAALAKEGIEPFYADIAANEDLTLPPAVWAGVETVLFAVGYERGSGQSIHDVYASGLARVLAACPPSVERFI